MELDNKREYYRKLVGIGIPVVFQNLISMSLNLVDTLMIGKLGEEELAAVGAGNQVFFVFTVALFGLYSGMAVYTAQYFGAGSHKLFHVDCRCKYSFTVNVFFLIKIMI